MNIYREKPKTVATVRELGGWRTTVTMGIRELTSEEIAANREELQDESQQLPGKAWTGEEVAVLHHTEPSPDAGKMCQAVDSYVNALTDEKILSGFVWKDMPVWLSTENQFNFKAAYDLAVQTQGVNLPVTFKLGENDGNPVYYTFADMDDLMDFYISAIMFIQTCLAEGWQQKDSFKASI